MSNKKTVFAEDNIWGNFLTTFLAFLASYCVGMLVGIVLTMPIRMIANGPSGVAEFLTCFLGAVVMLFILSRRRGYRNREFDAKKLVLSILMTFAVQSLLVLVLGGHALWVNGPTMLLGSYVGEIMGLESEEIKQTVYILRWIFFVVAYALIYTPAVIFGVHLGVKKRKKESEEYLAEQNRIHNS